MAESFLGFKNPRNFTYDDLLLLKDAGLVAASAAATVDSAAKIYDLGGAGFTEGNLVLDVTALEVASGNETYDIVLEGSNSATFANTVVPLAIARMGDSSTTYTSADDSIGRYVQPFSNERNGTYYRYLRVYTRVAGSIDTGINYSAFLAKK